MKQDPDSIQRTKNFVKKISVLPDIWLDELPRYPFVELRRKKEELQKKGVDIIDFSIGDPVSPTPDFILEAAASGMKRHKTSGYPDNHGLLEFRKEVSRWFLRRFGVELDPAKEIFPSLGAKEAIFSFPRAIKGEVVIVPTPGYPPYYSGAKASNKEVYLYPLLPENNFLPDLASIPSDVAKRSKIFWINYPNNPTTVVARGEFYKELIEFCMDYDIIIASDECYSEMYEQEPPESILQYGKTGIIVFQSLSKRSNMTGWRVGFMVGDSEIIEVFLKAKENMDSGCANFIQEAAIAALQDEHHVEEMRKEYNKKRNILKNALLELGLREGYSEGTFYIWQPVPDGMTSLDFATRLLEEDIGIVVTPGVALSLPLSSGCNPGEGFVRFALVPTIERVIEAAERLVRLKKELLKTRG